MPKLIYPDSCLDCGHELSRSRRRGWFERFLARCLKIGVFRCHRCGARFYSPPAVVIHAHKGNPDRVRELLNTGSREPVEEPETISPAAPAKIVVKFVSPAASTWPSPRQDWTQHAVRTTTSATPWFSIQSSTSDRDNKDSR